MVYEIRVLMKPYIIDSPKAPYFWRVLERAEFGAWRIVDSGWSKTPEAAWQAAQSRYKEITGGTQHDNGRST